MFAIQEKNEILKLKAETFGIDLSEGQNDDLNKQKVHDSFPRLAIDAEYLETA